MSGTVDKLSSVEKQVNQKPRSFRLKHVFKNMSKLEENNQYWSDIEDHYGVQWYVQVAHKNDNLAIYLHCDQSQNEKEWSINTEFEIHLLRSNESFGSDSLSCCFFESAGYGKNEIMEWEKMGNECLVNDELVVEICVKITQMTGIELCLRQFDDEECSDIALVVNGKKFHISKLYLASQSSYFKSMFLGKFNESGKAEIELTGIDGYSLQKYLEMLYGEDALDDETVGGILQLADMYDTKTLIGKCEEYLLEVSRKTLKEKLEMSVKYNLDELKRKCMSEIKTLEDIRSALPADLDDMDHSLMASLFKKTLDLK